MPDTSPRYALPFLFVGQAQKEMSHNEALQIVDALLHPVVEGEVDNPASLSAADGQCWLIGATPVGDWTGKAAQIAHWTGGGWRYLVPRESLRVYDRVATAFRQFRDGAWTQPPAPPAMTGGAVVDMQARAAIGQIITQMQQIGAFPS